MYGNSMSYKASQLYQSNEKLLQNMLKGIVMLTTTTDQTALWRHDVNSLLKLHHHATALSVNTVCSLQQRFWMVRYCRQS